MYKAYFPLVLFFAVVQNLLLSEALFVQEIFHIFRRYCSHHIVLQFVALYFKKHFIHISSWWCHWENIVFFHDGTLKQKWAVSVKHLSNSVI